MEKITVYQKPTCSNCRGLSAILKEKQIDFDAIDYYVYPISKERLLELLSKMNCGAADIIRVKEAIYQDLDLKNQKLSDEQLVEIMIENPDLIQRPIVEIGEKAILARPPEKVLNIL